MRRTHILLESGGDLLSRAVSSQVPSALKGLTSVFGMGTGGTPSPLPPETVSFFGGVRSAYFVSTPFAHLVLPKVPYCSSGGKSSSSRMKPPPSGFHFILPSGLPALPAMLPACHFRCVLPAFFSPQARLRILTTAQ